MRDIFHLPSRKVREGFSVSKFFSGKMILPPSSIRNMPYMVYEPRQTQDPPAAGNLNEIRFGALSRQVGSKVLTSIRGNLCQDRTFTRFSPTRFSPVCVWINIQNGRISNLCSAQAGHALFTTPVTHTCLTNTDPIGPKRMLSMGQKIYKLAIRQLLVKKSLGNSIV